MSKSFRWFKNFNKRIGVRRKLTFADYKKGVHAGQKIKKRRRKNYMKVKSMLGQGRKYVVSGNTLYGWGKDKKYIVALKPDFDMTRRVFEIIKNGEVEE